LLRVSKSVRTDDDIRRDRATPVSSAACIRLERRARTPDGIGLEGIRHHLNELAAGKKLALFLDRAAAWRIPLRGRHLERVTALERKHRLYQSLSERRRADDQRAIVVLQSARDNLGSRRTSA